MGNKTQAKGIQHIRNLKKKARIMWKEYNMRQNKWLDCIEASMLQHRIECLKNKKKESSNESSGNPS